FTLRDLIVDVVRAGGHQWIVGTPEKIADVMIDWFDSGACDGFSLNPPFAPGGFHRIFDLLVPELQRRGYFRTEYTGTTLREHLGAPRRAAGRRARPLDAARGRSLARRGALRGIDAIGVVADAAQELLELLQLGGRERLDHA